MHMHLKNKNAQLKGRRRYLADLEDMAQACGPGFIVRGFGVRCMCELNFMSQFILKLAQIYALVMTKEQSSSRSRITINTSSLSTF